MALNKSKNDIITKITSLPRRRIDIYDPYGDWGDYYNFWDDNYDLYDFDYDYQYVSNLKNLDNLLSSTSILWRGKMCKDDDEFKRFFNYFIIDMNSIYDTSKRREIKIDRILGLLDNLPGSHNKIEDFLK